MCQRKIQAFEYLLLSFPVDHGKEQERRQAKKLRLGERSLPFRQVRHLPQKGRVQVQQKEDRQEGKTIGNLSYDCN